VGTTPGQWPEIAAERQPIAEGIHAIIAFGPWQQSIACSCGAIAQVDRERGGWATGEGDPDHGGHWLPFAALRGATDTCTTCFRARSADEHMAGGHAFTGAPLPVDEPDEPPTIDTSRMPLLHKPKIPARVEPLDEHGQPKSAKRLSRETWLIAHGMSPDAKPQKAGQLSRQPAARHAQYLKTKLRRAMGRQTQIAVERARRAEQASPGAE
jgi:hypothetical protein